MCLSNNWGTGSNRLPWEMMGVNSAFGLPETEGQHLRATPSPWPRATTSQWDKGTHPEETHVLRPRKHVILAPCWLPCLVLLLPGVPEESGTADYKP